MLLLNVTYTMKPGMRDTFLKEVQAQGILDAVRQEDGASSTPTTCPRRRTTPCCWWSAGGTGRPSRPT